MTTTALTSEAVTALASDAKIGLLATIGPKLAPKLGPKLDPKKQPDAEARTDQAWGQGGALVPHVTLITSLHAKTPTELMWAQFAEGQSKTAVQSDPRVGFLVMNQERQVFRGSARWTRAVTSGDDYIWYNKKPLFRYNSYFGVHTIHYMDLVEAAEAEKLCMPSVVGGSLLASAGRYTLPKGKEPALKPWATSFINKTDTMKFLSWIREDGYPTLVPVVPAATPDGRRVIFTPTVYRQELRTLTKGSSVAVFALNLAMESVLVRGTFQGYAGLGPLSLGSIDVDWVYNSMPPKQGQIYPERPLEAVTSF